MYSLTTSDSKDTQHIVLIDDDHSVRQGLELMLTNLDYMVHSYSDPVVFLNSEFEVTTYIIVCDMNMPHLSGVQMQAALANQGRGEIPIIFISGESSIEQSITAMKQGAVEFLTKPFNVEDLLSAIENGFELAAKIYQNALKKHALENQLKKLSPREREVFHLLSMGYNNTEILKKLDISLPTTKQYKSEVMRKLNLNSLSELIALQH